jgi:hypothetical protein
MRLDEITQPLPTRSFAKLFHVGTLKISDKRRGSYEGAGLSVSLHPEEWMQIARIAGTVWQCTRAGNRFLNFYRLTKVQKVLIGDWAVKHRLAQRTTMWRVSFWDEEAEEKRYFDFTDQNEAQEEADNTDGATIKKLPGALIGTPAMHQRMMQDRPDPADALEHAAIAYAEDALKIDGVWFNERLDPGSLSAPRGVIVPSMIGHWQFVEIS